MCAQSTNGTGLQISLNCSEAVKGLTFYDCEVFKL